ncbi:hypothetical protein, partial [Anaerotruncus massiliensis (ex Liu et al. 2021)]|uniref:hypothetical protein n=1 Tax=Anaerotruncus massiliensis (ex Liu et al. 2021) TaxID=2321404 RepID=UPI003AB5C7BB
NIKLLDEEKIMEGRNVKIMTILGLVGLLALVTPGCSGQENINHENISVNGPTSAGESVSLSYLEFLKEKVLANEVPLPDGFKPDEGDVELRLVAEFPPSTLRYTLLSVDGDVTQWVLLVDKEGEINSFLIGDNLLNAPTVRFGDIDADNGDEIILQCELDGAGTTGPYFRCIVLKYKCEESKVIYDSDEETQWIDLGFRFAFLNQYQGLAKNVRTGKEVAIDTSDYLIYDDSGQIEDPLSIIEDKKFFENAINTVKSRNNFLIFKPQDIDRDGKDEILVREDFFIDYQFARRIGACYAVLEYGPTGFTIKDCNFIGTYDLNRTASDENWLWINES